MSATATALKQKQDELDQLQTQGQSAATTLAASQANQTERLKAQDKVIRQIAQWQTNWAAAKSLVNVTPPLTGDAWQTADTLAAGQQAAAQALATLALSLIHI